MEGGGKISIVDLCVVVEGVDEGGDRGLREQNIFVFTKVDGPFDTVGFVVVHGVAYAKATHEIGDPGFFTPEIFAQDEMEMVGEEEEGVERHRTGAKLRGVTFVDYRTRSQAFDPGEGSGVGEAQIVGEKESEGLVVFVGFEEGGVALGGVFEVVGRACEVISLK